MTYFGRIYVSLFESKYFDILVEIQVEIQQTISPFLSPSLVPFVPLLYPFQNFVLLSDKAMN
jgi:hypothetical protein